MNWVFKNIKELNSNSDSYVYVNLEQKRRFSGEVGQYVISLDRIKNSWYFTKLFRIVDIEIVEKAQLDNYFSINIKLQLFQEFGAEKPLLYYIYSISRINNYLNPLKHFNFKYNRLDDSELDAIRDDKIYFKRTVIGTILNSMHIDHKKGFISYISSRNPNLLIDFKVDLAYTLLQEYLKFSIIAPAKQLNFCNDTLKRIVGENESELIGFFDNDSKSFYNSPNIIKKQIDVISEYIEILESYSNDSKVIQESSYSFEKLFRGKKIPITL